MQLIPPFGAEGVDLRSRNPSPDGIAVNPLKIVSQAQTETQVRGAPGFFHGIENQARLPVSLFEMKIDPLKGVETIEAVDVFVEGFHIQRFPGFCFYLGLENLGRKLGSVFHDGRDAGHFRQLGP